MRRALAAWLLIALPLLAAGCTSSDDPTPASTAAAEAALRVAQAYVDGYYHRFPEEAYEVGYPDAPLDSLGDRSEAAMQAWRAAEDGWLAELRAIDPAALAGTAAAVPYAFALDRLEAAATRRICRTELWNVSPTWTGWQSMLASTFAQQPVATPAERAAALARLRTVPRYLDTEIANLRAGMAAGYLAAESSVAAVLRQVDELLATAPEASPFYDPALRAGEAGFAAEVRSVIADQVRPAIARYRSFLAGEYRARPDAGVAANPDGAACYAASVRFWTSVPVPAEQIHETGKTALERIRAEIGRVARASFETDDVPALLEQLRTDPQYTFASEEDVIAYARETVDRAARAVPDWFGFVPDAQVVVKPFPAYQKASGGGFYSAGSADGTRPGTYELGTYQPGTISRAGMQATTVHETYPGHHLQMSVALYGEGVHPLLRYMYVASTAEGWALYSEVLADEMGIYSSDVDRIGMLSNQALRAARLVVDPGLHVLGWTREQAIEFMLANTADSRASIESEVDRYIAVPGQATAYLLGSLQIQRYRLDSERILGRRFDIKAFHDLVLRNGAVSLPMLQQAIEQWIMELRTAR